MTSILARKPTILDQVELKKVIIVSHNVLPKHGLQEEAKMLQVQSADLPLPGSMNDNVEQTLRSALSVENLIKERKSFESRHEVHGLGPFKVDISVGGLFKAVYDLDLDRVGVILNSGKVDVNAASTLTHLTLRAESEKEPRQHMLQSFSSCQFGKVTCQLFEKIDHEETAQSILHLIQVFHSSPTSDSLSRLKNRKKEHKSYHISSYH